MLGNTKDLKELAQATGLKLNLNQAAVEKDFYITKAIYLLTQVTDEYFSLLFQGGTSLSKGYQAIQRISEDIDFRVTLKPKALTLGKETRRKKLRDFRYALINTLKNAHFIIQDDAINVLYEGRFMSIQAEFTDAEK